MTSKDIQLCSAKTMSFSPLTKAVTLEQTVFLCCHHSPLLKLEGVLEL